MASKNKKLPQLRRNQENAQQQRSTIQTRIAGNMSNSVSEFIPGTPQAQLPKTPKKSIAGSRIARSIKTSTLLFNKSAVFGNRGLTRPSVASEHSCSKVVGEARVVGVLRPSAPAKTTMRADVFVSKPKGKSKSVKSGKFQPKMVLLKDGCITLTNCSHEPGKEDRQRFHVYNMCDLKFNKRCNEVLVQVLQSMKTVDLEHEFGKSCKLKTFHFKFSNKNQSENFAKTLLSEADDYATVIDINLGFMQIHRTDAEKEGNKHLECLLRKRLDLFNISKKPNSMCVQFAYDAFIAHLRETGREGEVSYWETMKFEDDSGLMEFREEQLQKRKDNKFAAISESVDTVLFSGSQDKGTGSNTSSWSYYVTLHNQGKITEAE